jgi:putative drug exporter of the RND superfamily
MMSQGGMRWLARLGGFCARHARVVVIAWAVALALASVGAHRLPALLFSGSGDIPGSPSLRVDHLLRTEFAKSHAQLLVLALHSASLDREPEAATTLFRALEARLKENPLVAEVMVEEKVQDKRMLPVPGTGHIALISLKAADVREAEQAIPLLRTAVEPLLRAAKARHTDLEWATTGRAALTYDLNQFNAQDTTKAELRALPLTLLILILAFGSLVAAGLPLILGLVSTTLALGLVYLVAQSVVLSNLVQNVASMIGLAVGIDYSLFVLHRYRQEIRRLLAEQATPDRARRQQIALEKTMATAGAAVFFSGLTVLIGMGGLLATPLMETRSLGFGGCVVVSIAVAASLTLLPALLSLLGPVLLEWPPALSRRLHGERARQWWGKWADTVMRYPVTGAIVSLAALLVLAWPGLQTRFGFPEGPFLPAELEFTRGMDLLRAMNLKGLLSPLPIVLTDTTGGRALKTERVPALLAFSGRLRRDKRVAIVQGPVDLADDWPPAQYAVLYANVDAAFATVPYVRDFFVSRDQKRILIEVFPTRESTLEDTKALARAIPAWMEIPGMRIDLGGQPVYYNDFDVAVKAAYGRSVGFVLVFTCLVLLLVFRAPLVAVKALVLNALSVLAGYGVVVYVFQQGHGSSWLGVTAPTEVVPLTIPLLIFCILFGLSMDYEVFLLTRARAAFQRTGDNTASVREALADTGSVITSAALIMVAVFGAFTFARVVLVQMLGLGLAVAVLVDATVIRSLLGPALMRVAGGWNWWPLAEGRSQGDT